MSPWCENGRRQRRASLRARRVSAPARGLFSPPASGRSIPARSSRRRARRVRRARTTGSPWPACAWSRARNPGPPFERCRDLDLTYCAGREALCDDRARVLGHPGDDGAAQSGAAVLPRLDGLQVEVPGGRIRPRKSAGSRSARQLAKRASEMPSSRDTAEAGTSRGTILKRMVMAGGTRLSSVGTDISPPPAAYGANAGDGSPGRRLPPARGNSSRDVPRRPGCIVADRARAPIIG